MDGTIPVDAEFYSVLSQIFAKLEHSDYAPFLALMERHVGRDLALQMVSSVDHALEEAPGGSLTWETQMAHHDHSPPGETFREEMEFLGMSLSDAAKIVELSEREFLALLRGMYTIDRPLARRLARVCGTERFWMTRERHFRMWQAHQGMARGWCHGCGAGLDSDGLCDECG